MRPTPLRFKRPRSGDSSVSSKDLITKRLRRDSSDSSRAKRPRSGDDPKDSSKDSSKDSLKDLITKRLRRDSSKESSRDSPIHPHRESSPLSIVEFPSSFEYHHKYHGAHDLLMRIDQEYENKLQLIKQYKGIVGEPVSDMPLSCVTFEVAKEHFSKYVHWHHSNYDKKGRPQRTFLVLDFSKGDYDDILRITRNLK